MGNVLCVTHIFNESIDGSICIETFVFNVCLIILIIDKKFIFCFSVFNLSQLTQSSGTITV